MIGWPWSPSHAKYEWMIVATYMSLGYALLVASKNPMEHGLLYQWCIYGGFGVHATVMLIETLQDWSGEWQHVMPYGDVPGLYIMAILLHWAKSNADVKVH